MPRSVVVLEYESPKSSILWTFACSGLAKFGSVLFMVVHVTGVKVVQEVLCWNSKTGEIVQL